MRAPVTTIVSSEVFDEADVGGFVDVALEGLDAAGFVEAVACEGMGFEVGFEVGVGCEEGGIAEATEAKNRQKKARIDHAT